MNLIFSATFLLLIFLTGCTTPQALKLYVASNSNPLDAKYIDIDENIPATYYNFQLGEKSNNLLFFFSGTGCFSHSNYIKPYLQGLNNIDVFVLQKQGVKNTDYGFFCSESFHIQDNFDVWYKRQQKFISRILNNKDLSYSNVILMGVSEGANVAGALVNTDSRFTHLILISPLGKKMPDFLTEIGPNFGISKIEIEKKLLEIKNNPDSNTEYYLGKTFKYWSSFSSYDPEVNLSITKKPILVGVGELDINTPPMSIQKIFNSKINNEQHNFKLIIYPGSNHILVDSKGNSNRELFLNEVNKFLLSTPKQ